MSLITTISGLCACSIGVYYWYSKSGIRYNLIDKNGKFIDSELVRYINDAYINTPIKALYSKLRNTIEIFYRTIDFELKIISLNCQTSRIMITSTKECPNIPENTICVDIDDFVKQLDIYINKATKYIDKYTFKDKDRFIKKIQSLKNLDCYAEKIGWKYIGIYKNKDNEKLAQIFIDNEYNLMKLEHNKQIKTFTFTLSTNTEDLAIAVMYYLAFMFASINRST